MPTTGHTDWENHNSKRHMSPRVHFSPIYNIQDTDATYRSVNSWMDKVDVVQIYNDILLRHKKEQNWVICSDVDETRVCYTEWSKSERKKNKYINTHICIESGKMVLMNLFAGKEQRHRRREWACGHSWGREGGMNWDSSTDKHTLACANQRASGKLVHDPGS